MYFVTWGIVVTEGIFCFAISLPDLDYGLMLNNPICCEFLTLATCAFRVNLYEHQALTLT